MNSSSTSSNSVNSLVRSDRRVGIGWKWGGTEEEEGGWVARIIEDEFPPRLGGGLFDGGRAPDVIFLLRVTPSTFRQCEDFSAKYQTLPATSRPGGGRGDCY